MHAYIIASEAEESTRGNRPKKKTEVRNELGDGHFDMRAHTTRRLL